MKRGIFLAALLLAVPISAQQPGLPVLIGARTVAALPAATPAHSISYGQSPFQKIELFLPSPTTRGEGRTPVVAYVHGGCWHRETTDDRLVRAVAAGLVEKGFAVWSIGYRQIDDEGGGYPGTFADVGAALDLLREHADTHDLDTGRVVLVGHGTGGTMALWAAGRRQLPPESPLRAENPLRPKGILALGAFTNLIDQAPNIDRHCGPDTIARLMAPEPGEISDTSPHQLLPSRTHTILLHGIYDPYAYPALGLAHVQAARKAGDSAEIQLAPNAGHYEPIAPGRRAFQQALAAIENLAR